LKKLFSDFHRAENEGDDPLDGRFFDRTLCLLNVFCFAPKIVRFEAQTRRLSQMQKVCPISQSTPAIFRLKIEFFDDEFLIRTLLVVQISSFLTPKMAKSSSFENLCGNHADSRFLEVCSTNFCTKLSLALYRKNVRI